MIPASTIARLATLGLTPQQTDAVACMLAEVEEATEAKAGTAIAARRASDRERQSRRRHVRSRDVTGHNATHVTDPSLEKEGPHTPKKTQPSPDPSLRSGKQPRAQAARTSIAEDAQPDDADHRAAEAAGMDQATFRAEWARFRDHHRAKGSVMADWHAAWRTWTMSPYRGTAVNGRAHQARAGPGRRTDTTNPFLIDLLDEADVRPSPGESLADKPFRTIDHLS